MSGTARDLLTWAAGQIGTLERPAGSNHQPYAAIAGHPNNQAWCATFIVAGLKANEVPLVPGTNTAFTPTMQSAFGKAGRLFDEPRAGDAGFKFHAELGRIAHVFFVEKVVGDFVQTIEGNTNTDGSRTGIGVFRLRRRWRNGGTLRGFGRPLYGPPAGRAVSLSIRKVPTMFLVKQDNTDRVWAITGDGKRRFVASRTALDALEAAGVPFNRDTTWTSELLQSFPQEPNSDITDR